MRHLVGRPLIRDPCPITLKEELLLHIQAILNFLPQADIRNMFHSMPPHVAAHNAARGG